MGNLYFTSDLHLGEDRLDIFYRDFYFDDVSDMHLKIIDNFNSVLDKNDFLIIVGDVCYDEKYIGFLNDIECENKILIRGNYDLNFSKKILDRYFINILDDKILDLNNGMGDHLKIYLTHKPKNAFDYFIENSYSEDGVKGSFSNKIFDLAIVGHIHSLWKVQKYPVPMINVSVDCWNFKPVSFTKIFDIYNAILNHYDDNVFLLKY